MANNLFFLSLADIFSVYPQIFKEVISDKQKLSEVYLPSDADWQEKMYYVLLEVQKKVNDALDSGKNFEEIMKLKEKPIFDASYIQSFSPTGSPNDYYSENNQKCSNLIGKTNSRVNVHWTLENICQAAQLLKKPPEDVTFVNEHEMRRVYSLIYDVFRYKVVLTNALKDIDFYKHFSQYVNDQYIVWLMLYELHQRSFQNRSADESQQQQELYKAVRISDVAESIWKFRTKLAASIARMRIEYCALSLSELLPIHLQNDKVAKAILNPLVTGWINPFLVKNKDSAEQLLNDYGFKIATNGSPLTDAHFAWDTVCPLFLSCVPYDRNEFTKSDLVTGNYFILQDRAFAIGPAVMSRLLDYFDLSGDIIQTHIDSPRSAAYLAALFYSVNRVNNYYVYGAGKNIQQYRDYMKLLGVNSIRLFSESFSSLPLDSSRFRRVVGIFANPPNSFSAISDPIDLICSRGGDLNMLEILTEATISDEGKHRVSLILHEQLLTLHLAMSRPQIQFLLYETHSAVTSENQDMINYALKIMNTITLEKHKRAFLERRRLEAIEEVEAGYVPSAAMKSNSPRKRNPEGVLARKESILAEILAKIEAESESVEIPDVDEFVCVDVPNMCKNRDNCLQSRLTGCFLSILRRKNITKLNAKFLIRMAEKRGLFGKTENSKTAKTKVIKPQESNIEKRTIKPATNHDVPKHSPNIDSLLSRLKKSTHASDIRSHIGQLSAYNHPILFNYKSRYCQRYLSTTLKKSRTSTQKLWWRYAINAVRNRDNKELLQMSRPVIRRRTYISKVPYPIHVKYI
uniref:SAM-dependent MTase RsmB/NOP-type domain-containing protein n=1 Tax=Glossina brevipalpis TaxID=37001 RepID=A0A1A9WQ06_9MUSC